MRMRTKNLKTRCSLITDDDRAGETDEIDSRAKNAKELERKNLKVFLAERTFEFELFVAGNKDILIDIFREMHPVAANRIVEDEDVKIYAANFLEKVVANKAKSELAHRLAMKLALDEAAITKVSAGRCSTAGTGAFYWNHEDSEQGGDYDQDMWGRIQYAVSGSKIAVTTDVIAESTGSEPFRIWLRD